jgi:hypothetical protein
MNYRRIYEEDFGIKKISHNGNQGLGCCPVHNDKNPSFTWSLETGQNHCFSCGWKGNTYLLAKELNMENPRQYLDSTNTYLNNSGIVRYEPNNVVKIDSGSIDKVELWTDYEAQKKRYINNKIEVNPVVKEWKQTYFGKDDNGNVVFFYPNAIKHHKSKTGKSPYWEGKKDINGKVIGSHVQIFMEEEMSGFNRSKTLYIFEGEPDTLVSPLQGITFSGGCKSIPKDISSLYCFYIICIIYDNDNYGYDGAEKLAKRIKAESPNTIVKIAQWDSSLPDGYDVKDDFIATNVEDGALELFENVDKAITNAIIYELNEDKEDEQESKTFEIVNPMELMDMSPEPPKTIIENLLVEKGVTIVSGTDGVGKTWFGLQMAVCIAAGRDLIDLKVNQKPVMMIQFELSNAQLSSRLKKYDLSGTDKNLHFTNLSDDDLIFTDAWDKIGNTLIERNFSDGVVIVDNLYTSTDKDVSKNHELKPLLKMLNHIKNITNNAFVLIAHHNKNDGDKEPLLTKSIITGGKTLTNYVSNVFQIGTSSMGAEIRRAKFTKMRDSYTELQNEPIRLLFNPDTCLFEFGGVIVKEVLHTEPVSKRWEYSVLIDFAERNHDEPEFDRKTIQLFMEGTFPDDTPNNVITKTTRWLNKMLDFGLISKTKYSNYKLNSNAIKDLNLND